MSVHGVNHIAFRTRDPAALRAFYLELTAGEALEGAHAPVRLGATLLVFFESHHNPIAEDPDEIAFDVDRAGFDEVLARAMRLGCLVRPPVAHTRYSKGFVVRDPEGRRIEFVHDDRAVYWSET